MVTSGRLQEELMLLYTETRDPRFIGALDALRENDLLDGRGSWRPRYISPRFFLGHRSHEAICVLSVWEQMKWFNSLRLACAFLVSHWQLPGQSFEAACKELERLYRSYAKAGVDFGQLADEISSNDRELRM